MQSTYSILGLPDAVAASLVTLGVILSLAPYAAGHDFGVFKVPKFGCRSRRRLRIVGPILFATFVGGFFPAWPGTNDEDIMTWKRNYALFGPRSFPQVTQTRLIDDPQGSGKSYDVRAEILRDLRLLFLDGHQSLDSKRDELVRVVEQAPIWNESNPSWFLVGDSLLAKYHEFKSELRATAEYKGVDVQQADRERWVSPE